jgi:hypothetical protein
MKGQSMNRELEEYYSNQFGMFTQPGWTQLMEDITKMREQIDKLSAVVDTNDLYYRKGQLDIIDLFLNRKAMCEAAWEDLNNE